MVAVAVMAAVVIVVDMLVATVVVTRVVMQAEATQAMQERWVIMRPSSVDTGEDSVDALDQVTTPPLRHTDNHQPSADDSLQWDCGGM